MTRELTGKQRAFCHHILDGKSPSEAYRLAGYANTNARIMPVNAQKTLKHPAVAAFIAQERQRLDDRRLMSREEKRNFLASIVRKGKGKLDPLKAIEIDNRMAGHNAPEKVEITDIGDLMQAIRSSAPKP